MSDNTLAHPPVFRIDPHTLYSREALAAELEGLVDLETFLARAPVRKRFKSLYWGQDIIDGLNGPVSGQTSGKTSPGISSAYGGAGSRSRPNSPARTRQRLNPAAYAKEDA